jgi:hypothetical protein
VSVAQADLAKAPKSQEKAKPRKKKASQVVKTNVN